MKTRRLHEIDLACAAPLEHSLKEKRLKRLKAGPPYLYAPFRAHILDIVNADPGPLAPSVARAPWELIAASIRHDGRFPKETEANLRVGEGLYTYVSDKGLSGFRRKFSSLLIRGPNVSQRVVYWSPFILDIDGQLTLVFFDPRRRMKLTRIGRQFVFSAMHRALRASDRDLAGLRLAIFQFDNSKEGPRKPILHFGDSVELFGANEFDAMVSETYELWREIHLERRAEGSRGQSGDFKLIA